MSKTFSRDLLTGLAVLLADAGVGHWDPVGAYTAQQRAITLGGLPSKPDEAISLTIYGTGTGGDDVEQSDSTVLVQARMRTATDPRIVGDYADAVFAALHGRSNLTLSTGVVVLLIQRTIMAALARDSSGRWERPDSYELMVVWPTLYRD
ncbi:minor capsid protein [Nonomuraea sp. NPDC049784]|uniref:minor capsid protein n=1 Tax=Nonomuraea sp. NPDC049784 TaxID=3154361 RepID=UPI0033C586DB